jgi:hypothetical protein
MSALPRKADMGRPLAAAQRVGLQPPTTEPHALMMDPTQSLKFVQPGRIFYEDFPAHRSVRRPGGQEIEYKPVIDLPQRRDL